MKNKFILYLLIVLLLFYGNVNIPAAVLDVTDTNIGARAKALGSMAAAIDDSDSLLLNPASISYFSQPVLGLTYNKYLMDTSLNSFTLAYPLENSGIGLTVNTFNGGSLDLIESGQLKGTVTAQKDELFALSYSRQLFDGFSAGLSGKYVSSSLIEKYSASAFAADCGLLWAPAESILSAGLSVHNIGTALRYRSLDESLPVNADFGICLKPIETYGNKLLIGGGVNWKKDTESYAGTLGTEYSIDEIMSFRINYSLDKNNLIPFNAGLGFFIWHSRLDYTWTNYNNSENMHSISISTLFGSNGLLGKAEGFYKKGMYSRAYKYYKEIPKTSSDYASARKMISLCENKLTLIPQKPKKIQVASIASMNEAESSEKYPVEIKIMKDIPTAIYNLMPQMNIMPISVLIANNTEKKAEFKIMYSYEPKSQQQSATIKLEPKKEARLNLFPKLPSSVLSMIITPESQIVHVNVYLIDQNGDLKKIRDDFTDYVTLHPCNQYFTWINNALGEKIDTINTIAAWVTYNDPSMIKVLSKASEKGLKHVPPVKIVGGQDPRVFLRAADQIDNDFLKQIEIIYNVLKEDYSITYLNQPIINRPGVLSASQRIKFPYSTLQFKGNCIENAVLFAALLESIEINPVIMLLPSDGHCIVGWEVVGIDKSKYHFLETNMFGEDFKKSLTTADAWVDKYSLSQEFDSGLKYNDDGVYKKGNDVIILNIKKLRKYIPPTNYIFQ
jgi:hypothetical protein